MLLIAWLPLLLYFYMYSILNKILFKVLLKEIIFHPLWIFFIALVIYPAFANSVDPDQLASEN